MLHDEDALLVLLESKVGDALLVEHLCVAFGVVLQRRGKVVDRHLVLLHVEVALSSVLEELDFCWSCGDCLVEVVDSFVKIAQGMITATEPVVDCRIFIEIFSLVEILNGFVHQFLF